MTQLLLFDAPVHSTFPVPTESPESPTGPSAREGKEPQRRGGRQGKPGYRSERQPSENEKKSAEELTPPRGGVHRMGDLASLVIARYELVAKRRAALLARGPLPSVRF